jgi:hypothetical protein
MRLLILTAAFLGGLPRLPGTDRLTRSWEVRQAAPYMSVLL